MAGHLKNGWDSVFPLSRRDGGGLVAGGRTEKRKKPRDVTGLR